MKRKDNSYLVNYFLSLFPGSLKKLKENKNMDIYNRRWYDKIADLGIFIEKMKDIKKRKREKILVHLKDLIMKHDPEIVDKHVVDFPMGIRKRWYDKDPYSWLIINSLKFAKKDLIDEVIEYFKKHV